MENITKQIANQSADFGWELSPEFLEALNDELQFAHDQDEGNGIQTLLYALSSAAHNASLSN